MIEETNIAYYQQEHRGDFSLMAKELVVKICSLEEPVPLRIVFFGSAASEEEYILRFKKLKQTVCSLPYKICPVVNFVAMPPFECALAAEVTFVRKEIKITPHEKGLIIETSMGREMVTEGIGAADGKTIFAKGEKIFSFVHKILDGCNMKPFNIVRQWNYIEHITFERDNLQNYQQFNDARSVFYNSSIWPHAYPAATGIGAFGGGVVVELNALVPREGVKVVPIDNKLQVAAHHYSQRVLAGKTPQTEQKSTPKFERAKMIACTNGYKLYISGTAAIRGEQSLGEMGVVQQASVTMENIKELLSASQQSYTKLFKAIVLPPRLLHLRVYVRNPEDFPLVRNYITANYPTVPTLYLQADICRRELLIEIEGTAISIQKHE